MNELVDGWMDIFLPGLAKLTSLEVLLAFPRSVFPALTWGSHSPNLAYGIVGSDLNN